MDVIVNSNGLKSNFMPLTLRLTYRYSVLEFSPPRFWGQAPLNERPALSHVPVDLFSSLRQASLGWCVARVA
jgi:hypothetical protein